MWIVILIVLIVGLAAVLLKIVDKRLANVEPTPDEPDAPDAPADTHPVDPIPYSSEAIDAATERCFRLAFDAQHGDYPIADGHAAVLESIARSLDDSVYERDYFPRRPLLLPKLLQAINDDESTRQELVRLIMEDPTLAGAVLQRANSAYYRVAAEPVESLDRAVFMLGSNGLRGLMAAAILQPVFRTPTGSFENFATITWEQGERTAAGAEACARANADAEPIVAQLLGLISLLANIVLFRLTMDKYRDHPTLLPRAEVFIQAIRQQRACMASLIAQAWKLSDISIAAFTEQQQQLSPSLMSSLGRCVYFGDLCGVLSVLAARGYYSNDQALALLIEQGADREAARAMWTAATANKQAA